MVLVGACTGDTPDPDPSGSGSASPTASATPSFVPSDQSAKVLSSQLPAVQGSATGIVSKEPATLNVADVKATAGGTLLTYWFTGAETSLLGDQGEKSWENLPTLVDVPGEKIYEPFTFTHNRGETFCLCTDATYVRGVPQPRTIYYPALPDTVTTIGRSASTSPSQSPSPADTTADDKNGVCDVVAHPVPFPSELNR